MSVWHATVRLFRLYSWRWVPQTRGWQTAGYQAVTNTKTKWNVRAFPGINGYYHKLIPNYATVAVPLTD